MRMIKRIFNKYRKLPIQVKGSFWFLICAFLQRGISFITTPIFTRILTTSEYGEYSVFSSWMGIISVFVSMNFYNGVYIQGLVKFDKTRGKYTSSLQGLTIVVTMSWFVVYLLFHNFFNSIFSLTTVQMCAMFLMIWSTSVFGFWSQEKRADYNYRNLVILTILISILTPLLSIILVVFCSDKVTSRILGITIIDMIFFTPLFFSQMKRGRVFYDKHFWKYAVIFNLPLVPHYLSMTILNSSDRIMIKQIVGDSEAGIYNLAYSLSQIMAIFSSALLQTIEPWLYKKIKEKQIERISSVVYPALIGVAFVNLFLIALAPEAVKIFAPIEYYDAIYVIPPIAMGTFFSFAYTFFAVFEFYYEKTKLVMLATSIGAILNIILNYICIRHFGYIAAGYTTLICYMFFAVFHYLFMNKLCNRYLDTHVYDLKILLCISFIFVSSSFLIMLTYGMPMLRFFLVVFLALLLFLFRKTIIMIFMKFIKLKQDE